MNIHLMDSDNALSKTPDFQENHQHVMILLLNQNSSNKQNWGYICTTEAGYEVRYSFNEEVASVFFT